MFRTCLPHETISYILGSNTKENVLGEECSTYVRDDKFIQYFSLKYNLED
jgi:hypothetical protein